MSMFLWVQLQKIHNKTKPIQIRKSASSVQEYCFIFVRKKLAGCQQIACNMQTAGAFNLSTGAHLTKQKT